jgi:LPPG:FO 2-phospho-L-lactate transferase
MIVVLTGGTGGAKFVDGLSRVVPPEDLTIIVNTGDDHEWWGLYVSPDIDSITYVLAGLLSNERGWGIRGDTFHCLQAMEKFGEPTWFSVGDRDLATHLLRSRLLAKGNTLTEATQTIAERLGIRARILPMSDMRVETRIDTPVGELSFEEYFVQRRYQDKVNSVRFAGSSEAKPAPGVLAAISTAEVVLIAPSNPITSIGPILAVPGIRDALAKTSAQVVAVSPIIGATAFSGPAGALMAAQGLPVSIAGIANAYGDFLDVLLADNSDRESAPSLELCSPERPRPGKAGESVRKRNLQIHCTDILMRKPEAREALARTVLSLARPELATASAQEVK